MQSFLFLLCIPSSVLRGRCFVLTRDASITDAVNLVRRPPNICGGRLLVRSELLLASSLSMSCSSKNDLLNVHVGNGTVRESSQRYFTFSTLYARIPPPLGPHAFTLPIRSSEQVRRG